MARFCVRLWGREARVGLSLRTPAWAPERPRRARTQGRSGPGGPLRRGAQATRVHSRAFPVV
eukprot:9032433-Alexandrium_andersonii.AAC.1